ncbi:MAG: TadE/TadG family type IV pilus assembly protein [Pikeienuella sp.]
MKYKLPLMRLRAFLTDNRGSAASLEYVVLLLPLLALVFTSFQIALAYHFSLTAQKAVELGARIAAVRDPVYTALPATNTLNDNGTFAFGDACASGACVDMGGPFTCTGEDIGSELCDATAWAAIAQEVANLAYLLDPEDLSITYSYAALGFANGPFTPIVEVRIRERPFFLQFFFNIGVGSDDAKEVGLPSVAATAIAEDLSSDN